MALDGIHVRGTFAELRQMFAALTPKAVAHIEEQVGAQFLAPSLSVHDGTLWFDPPTWGFSDEKAIYVFARPNPDTVARPAHYHGGID